MRKPAKANTFEGKFIRVSPAKFMEKTALPVGWFVVRFGLMRDKSARRKSHGEWFSIKSDKRTIYRMLRFSVNLKGSSANGHPEMVLDWAGWIDLYDREDNVDAPLRLMVRRVPWWHAPWVYLKHPDPAVRLSVYLGWASILLGGLSILLSLVIWRLQP